MSPLIWFSLAVYLPGEMHLNFAQFDLVNNNIRNHYFTNRIVSTWNTLPNIVVNVDSVNAFKNALDKHWQKEEVLYDYRAKLSGTGVRGINV